MQNDYSHHHSSTHISHRYKAKWMEQRIKWLVPGSSSA